MARADQKTEAELRAEAVTATLMDDHRPVKMTAKTMQAHHQFALFEMPITSVVSGKADSRCACCYRQLESGSRMLRVHDMAAKASGEIIRYYCWKCAVEFFQDLVGWFKKGAGA